MKPVLRDNLYVVVPHQKIVVSMNGTTQIIFNRKQSSINPALSNGLKAAAEGAQGHRVKRDPRDARYARTELLNGTL